MPNVSFAAKETISLTVEQLNKLLHSENGTIVDGFKVVKCFVINWWEREEGQFTKLVVSHENGRKQYSIVYSPEAKLLSGNTNYWIDAFEQCRAKVDETNVVMQLYSDEVLRVTNNLVRELREKQ